jgi:hypothetical protein
MSAPSQWRAVRRGDGKVTGWLEVFFCRRSGGYVSVPGVSRWRAA